MVAFTADTVVVITGCSRGLGLEFVKQILDTTESHVVATARNPQKCEALTGLSSQYEKRLKLVTLDTEDEASIKAGVQEVGNTYSGVDLLINNAGICESVEEPVLEMTAAWYEKVMRVNVIGTYLVTRTFLPLLLKRETRAVVQISSGLGSIANNRLAMTDPEKNPIGNRFIAYNASKAAINMQTSVFANELKKENFCLVSMDPGWVDTEMGGGNARRLGMERAPTDAHYSISTMLKTIKQLKVENSGQFVSTDGSKMDF